jgi:hypothetical protein
MDAGKATCIAIATEPARQCVGHARTTGKANSRPTTARALAIFTIAIAIAGAITACAGGPQKESAGEFIDDSVLTTRVKAALLYDPAVSGLVVGLHFKGDWLGFDGIASGH